MRVETPRFNIVLSALSSLNGGSHEIKAINN